MVAQVLPNAGHIEHYRNPMGLQMRRWPQAREHQQVWRGHRSTTEDDLIRRYDEAFPTAFHFNTGCSGAVKQDTPHQRIASDSQIEAVTIGIQVGYGRAHAYVVGIAQRQRADAGGLWMVHVMVFRKVCRHARLVESLLKRMPGGARKTAHRNRASRAMHVITDVQVRFQFPEVGQDLAIRPCVMAQSSPAIKIFREAPEKNHVVNGTGAAHYLAAWRRSRS